MGIGRLKEHFRNIAKEIVIIASATGVIVGSLAVYNRAHPERRQTSGTLSRTPLLAVGARVHSNKMEFDKFPMSFLLLVSPTCKYCSASQPFHSQLVSACKQMKIPLYVLVPSKTAARNYLTELGKPEPVVASMEWKDIDMRVDGTPTIVVVDKHGIINRMWVGQLASSNESEILEAIHKGLMPPEEHEFEDTRNYSTGDLKKLKLSHHVSIVDPRERDSPMRREDAVRIPLIELPFRAPAELNSKDIQVVDCANVSRSLCLRAVTRLKQAGFETATLDAGSYARSCGVTSIQ